MAGLFFDTSGIVKRYVQETGSIWVNAVTSATARNALYIVRLTMVEVASAVTRRVRNGGIAPGDGMLVLSYFHRDVAHRYRLIGVTPRLIASAATLAQRHGLRGFDAVQLAAGLTANRQRLARRLSGITFISADKALLTAATAEGLVVEDPNTHP